MSKKLKNPGIIRVMLQWLLTFIGIIFVCAAVSVVLDDIDSAHYSGHEMLESDLRYGRYGSFFEYYYRIEEMSGTDDSVYDKYKEFKDFYHCYLEYHIFSEAAKTTGDSEYLNKAEESIQRAKEIAARNTYVVLTPHYDYILSLIKE